jgi:hypothetical protein
MGQWSSNLTESMEAEVQETIDHMDTLGWTLSGSSPSAQWSIQMRPRLDVPSKLAPKYVAVLDNVVKNLEDKVLGDIPEE